MKHDKAVMSTAVILILAFLLNMALAMTAHADEIKRGDLNQVVAQAVLEKSNAETAFQLELNKTQIETTIIAEGK